MLPDAGGNLRHNAFDLDKISRMRTAVLLFMFSTSLAAQSVTTMAGTGTPGFSGDGGPALKARINNPYGITIGPMARSTPAKSGIIGCGGSTSRPA